MGLIKDGLCWKWRTERGTYVHAFWECCKVFPFWRRCLGLYGPPMSARLWGALLQLNRFVVRASMVCFVTCARLWDYFQILKTHWTNDGHLCFWEAFVELIVNVRCQKSNWTVFMICYPKTKEKNNLMCLIHILTPCLCLTFSCVFFCILTFN